MAIVHSLRYIFANLFQVGYTAMGVDWFRLETRILLQSLLARVEEAILGSNKIVSKMK